MVPAAVVRAEPEKPLAPAFIPPSLVPPPSEAAPSNDAELAESPMLHAPRSALPSATALKRIDSYVRRL